MCKKRGDFGWKSYEETQRIGAGFAEMCNEQGGVAVDGEKVMDIKKTFAPSEIPEEGLVLRRGKKNFRKVVVK